MLKLSPLVLKKWDNKVIRSGNYVIDFSQLPSGVRYHGFLDFMAKTSKNRSN